MLRYTADVRSLAVLAVLAACMGACIAAGIGADSGPVRAMDAPWGIWALVAVALGWLVFLANIIKHNHTHCPMFRHVRPNVALNVLLGLLTGTSCSGIVGPHNRRHHRAPQSGEDFVRASLVRFRANAVNLALFPLIATVVTIRNKPSELVTWRRHRRLWRRLVLERVAIVAFALVVTLASPMAAVIVLFVPWIVGQFLLLLMNLLQHQHLEPADARRSSRDVVGVVSNAVFFNAGYHSAHHRMPGLHWSLLPAHHAAHIAGSDRAHLEHRSLTALVWDRLRAPGRAEAA